jgi:hypothetical protein
MRRVSVSGVAVRLRRPLGLGTTARTDVCVGQRTSAINSKITSWSRLIGGVIGCSRWLQPSVAKGKKYIIRTS